jgi:type II secretory ATPase GspE/PulE/Tfp pilus assembly ATPase PilB-like protein
VRLRIDGALEDCRQTSPDVHQAMISRLKIMAGLDIGENRVPQDGRLQAVVRGRSVDLRISTMPHMNGEGAFVRILEHRADRLALRDLGFPEEQVKALQELIRHSNGLFLVTGPTGSGKTTTLYALLRELHQPSRNIVTVEDPIEYRIEGINQIQINRRAGLDFPKALRSVLRQDPDIILVGEIRDRETASIAVQAALTGHFVLATLHTNDAATVVDRLVDMGVEPFLLAAVLRGAMAQRLVRQRIAEGRFSGRIPVAEIFAFTSEMRDLVTAGGRSNELKAHLEGRGFSTLAKAGEDLVGAGRTTREELLIALGE